MKVQQELVESFCVSLRKRESLPPLKPVTIWNPELSITLNRSDKIPKPIIAALALWNDDLQLSHEISRELACFAPI